MLIGIDASRYFLDQGTGVECYSRYIIDYLLKEIPKQDGMECVLYVQNIKDLPINSNVKVLPGKRFWTLRVLSREMKKNPPDVLFVPSHVLPLSLPKKSVITIHDVAFKHLKKSYSFKQYHYLNWSAKVAVEKATKIIVPSKATKEDLIKFYKCPSEKIKVIYHGFEPAKFDHEKLTFNTDFFKHFKIDEKMKYVFFVGRLESKKNILNLTRAFNEFSKTHSDYHLIMAGNRGVGFSKIYKKAYKEKILANVIMPGYVTEEEKATLYKHCKIFALPSLYEGFGLPILEAFHYDKPVLTSDCSSLKEVGGDAVCYCDPLSVESISEGLKKLVDNSDYAKNLVEKGKERLKMFSWEKCAKETLDVLMN